MLATYCVPGSAALGRSHGAQSRLCRSKASDSRRGIGVSSQIEQNECFNNLEWGSAETDADHEL
jgi:hypothetical protein